MKKVYLFLFLLMALSQTVNARVGGIIVVANTNNTPMVLTKQEVKSLFMGGALEVEFQPVVLPNSSPTRVIFNTKVLGLTESRVQSYWAQMRFTGRKKPPTQVSSQLELIEFLIDTPYSIGYLPKDTPIPDGLTVVYVPQ